LGVVGPGEAVHSGKHGGRWIGHRITHWRHSTLSP
jgi:hypothetical protein